MAYFGANTMNKMLMLLAMLGMFSSSVYAADCCEDHKPCCEQKQPCCDE